MPADYNKKLEAGAKTQGIGFIVSMTDDYKLGDYDIETVVTDDTLTASMYQIRYQVRYQFWMMKMRIHRIIIAGRVMIMKICQVSFMFQGLIL